MSTTTEETISEYVIAYMKTLTLIKGDDKSLWDNYTSLPPHKTVLSRLAEDQWYGRGERGVSVVLAVAAMKRCKKECEVLYTELETYAAYHHHKGIRFNMFLEKHPGDGVIPDCPTKEELKTTMRYSAKLYPPIIARCQQAWESIKILDNCINVMEKGGDIYTPQKHEEYQEMKRKLIELE